LVTQNVPVFENVGALTIAEHPPLMYLVVSENFAVASSGPIFKTLL